MGWVSTPSKRTVKGPHRYAINTLNTSYCSYYIPSILDLRLGAPRISLSVGWGNSYNSTEKNELKAVPMCINERKADTNVENKKHILFSVKSK